MLHRTRFENYVLESGVVLPCVELAYKTFGNLNESGDNCILLQTSFNATHMTYAKMIGRARALNPAKYFIVVPNLLGNGLSSSPSNMPAPFNGARFPNVTIRDNMRLQHMLLTGRLGVRRLALVHGWSMGVMQACAWAATYPEMVERMFAVCGTARCWPHTALFLQGMISSIKVNANFRDADDDRPTEGGLRTVATLLMGRAFSAAFFRDQLYHNLGYDSLEALTEYWESHSMTGDVNNQLAMFWTWRNAGMELEELQNITAKTVFMACEQDMYFAVEEARIETAQIRNAEFRLIDSPYGHCIGVPGMVSAQTVISEQVLKTLLAR